MKKFIVLLLAVLFSMVLLVGCTSEEPVNGTGDNATPANSDVETGATSSEKTVLKIGTTATNEQVTEAIRDALKEQGYELEIVMFQDSIQPNTALDGGEVDAIFMEHKAYMQSFNDNNGYNLKFLDPPIIFGPFCCYSDKYDNIEDLPNGAQVTICSDASNKDRTLLLLQNIGLIQLAEEPQFGDYYIVEDIVENPKNIQFVETEGPNVPTTLQDVDMIVVYNPNMYTGGYDTSGLLYTEPYTEGLSSFAQGVVINAKDEKEPWVEDMMKAFTSDTAKANLEKANDGSFMIVFDK